MVDRLLFWFIWLVLSSATALSSGISGVIYYEDGTTQEFRELTGISLYLDGVSRSAEQEGIIVEYKNTKRMVPYSKLKSMEVIKFKVDKAKRLNKEFLKEPRIQIITSTGITLELTYLSAHSVYAILLDELTGEVIKQEISFAKDGKLNIRKIEFKTIEPGS